MPPGTSSKARTGCRRETGGCASFRFSPGAGPFIQGNGTLRARETVEIVTPDAGGYGPPAATPADD